MLGLNRDVGAVGAADMLQVFGVEAVANGGHLAALGAGDPDRVPTFAGVGHGGGGAEA